MDERPGHEKNNWGCRVVVDMSRYFYLISRHFSACPPSVLQMIDNGTGEGHNNKQQELFTDSTWIECMFCCCL